MNRQNNVPFNPSAVPRGPAPKVYTPQLQQPARIPLNFREAMKQISVKPADPLSTRTPDMAVRPQPAPKRAGKSFCVKWKSSFKPLGGEDSQDKSTVGPERGGLYNPYDPVSSDSEQEIPHGQDHSYTSPGQDNNLGPQRLSPNRGSHNKSHWDLPQYEPWSRPPDRRNFSPETKPSESRGLSPGHRRPERLAYIPDTESLDPPGYDSIRRPLDHRVCSPDRVIHGASSQRLPASHGGQRTNGEERITVLEPMIATVRSPTRSQHEYQHQHQMGFVETEPDQITPSPEVTRNGSTNVMIDNPITCDLCDVEVANGQELEDHLDSKSHWETLEHVQLHNSYDDVVIAFLQEVMLYRSRQCSRAIEDKVLQALQENDHMTKIEMFHCAACKVFVSTSASSVQTHITSKEHLSNAKDFQVQQRHSCLDKAETMLKELKPQFEHFLKGGTAFEF